MFTPADILTFLFLLPFGLLFATLMCAMTISLIASVVYKIRNPESPTGPMELIASFFKLIKPYL